MAQELDLLLVNPGNQTQVYSTLSSELAGIEPPVWCGLLAGFMRQKGYSVKIIDAEAENLGPEQVADLIAEIRPCLTDIVVLGSNPSASSTPKMPAATRTLTALKARAPDLKTILSGLHPSALPERTLREEPTDFVCAGEGFGTLPSLVTALKTDGSYHDIHGLWWIEKGTLLSGPPASAVTKLDDLPFVAWDLLPMDRYRAHNWHCFGNINQRAPYAAIYTSLGCPFKCSYCNIHALYDGKPGIRYRSPEKVVEEIDLLVQRYNIRNLKIMDELFAIREERVMRICDLIIAGGYDLNMWAYARVDTVNESMLVKMKQAGINWVALGFESASADVRRGVAKRFSQDAIKRAVGMTQTAGINIIGNFIFGLPDDDLKTMRETLDMAKRFNFEYVNFYTAMAYPGSELYNNALRSGIKLPETWSGYSQYSKDTVPLPTKYISSAEVLRFRDAAFEEYYTDSKYLSMIQNKFGPEAVAHIHAMLQHKLKRTLLEAD